MPDDAVLRPLAEWPAALAWVEQTLAAHGLAVTGEAQTVRVRPWSMVAKIETGGSPVWFKANGGETRYEAPLLAALGRWAPAQSLVPLAVDAGRAWSLLPDGGPTLRESAGDDPAQWEWFLGVHARLQLALAPRVEDMVALGVPYLPTDALPGRFDALLDDPAVWAPAAEGLRDKLVAHVPAYRDACAELAGSTVPLSLEHDDLHDGNVFVGDTYRFFDWGDAYVGHPFALLLVALRVAQDRFSLATGGPELIRLRDAYLEPWIGFAPHAQLVREVSLALQVAKVARSLSWQRALRGAGPEALAEWGDAVSGWLGEMFEPDVI